MNGAERIRGLTALLAALALLGLVSPGAAAQLTAAPGSPFPTGSGRVTDIAAADFNRDGHLDLAAVSPESPGELAVLLGNGSAGFASVPGSPFDTGANSSGSVAAADMNGDGSPDLVTGNRLSNSVSVLPGNGAGGFTQAPGSPYATGGIEGTNVALGNLVGSPHPDVAVPGTGQTSIRVMVNNGSGVLATGAVLNPGANNPTTSELADLNGDSRLDIVTSHVVNPGRMSAFRNDGSGLFAAFPGSPFATFSSSHFGLDVGDVNSDGFIDAVLGRDSAPGAVVSMLGTGGGFVPAPGSPFAGGADNLRGVALADFTRDGRLDVVLAQTDFDAPGLAPLLAGDGVGGFAPVPGSPFPTGSSLHGGVVDGDFNEDGVPDVALSNAPPPNDGPGSVSVLLSPTPPAAPDTDPPEVSGVAAKPPRFRLARALTPLSGRARRGTQFVYTLSEPASVTLVVERILPGRRKAGRCVAPRRAPRGRRCKRFRRLVALTRAGGAGANGTRFTGRWRSGGRKRRLRPGRHRVSISARDLAGNSTARPARAGFRVVRR
jgi:FG-GAP-like repeat